MIRWWDSDMIELIRNKGNWTDIRNTGREFDKYLYKY